MSSFTNTRNIIRSFAAVIAGIWAYFLIVAPMMSQQNYVEVAVDKSQTIGIGFTVAALVVGTVWVFLVKRSLTSEHCNISEFKASNLLL
ncbi:hypothetical protein [Corynebacterium anserum]|uniref:hypothetical protein n=1 Tax=Corynebacterium anserum TaxID=2684406 RepID=UPI001C910544|nr:hypothetical protein [Corynebacterium anserum]